MKNREIISRVRKFRKERKLKFGYNFDEIHMCSCTPVTIYVFDCGMCYLLDTWFDRNEVAFVLISHKLGWGGRSTLSLIRNNY